MATFSGEAQGFPVNFILYTALFVSFLLALRLYILMKNVGKCKIPEGGRKEAIKTMLIIGSGGHTSEMLRLASGLSEMYSPRTYVIADTDVMSEEKVKRFETERKNQQGKQYTISRIPRSREVHQSWITTVFSTLKATLYAFPMVFKSSPDLILCNGPGTCIPLCAAALTMTFLGLKKVFLIYVESFCRVDTLSLSGKIMYHFADKMFVQWPELHEAYPKTTYMGRIV
ncbi:UDP-N-acetylglucosamine transferase subunit ALG14-like [Ptychodera flava]|uniref:UDP-N-acetylglucosamine transferase subunit ALG14-like n=1 Tax=Ptychodera flava TaxID=63121 RepID=UPI00396A0E6E